MLTELSKKLLKKAVLKKSVIPYKTAQVPHTLLLTTPKNESQDFTLTSLLWPTSLFSEVMSINLGIQRASAPHDSY